MSIPKWLAHPLQIGFSLGWVWFQSLIETYSVLVINSRLAYYDPHPEGTPHRITQCTLFGNQTINDRCFSSLFAGWCYHTHFVGSSSLLQRHPPIHQIHSFNTPHLIIILILIIGHFLILVLRIIAPFTIHSIIIIIIILAILPIIIMILRWQ